MIIKPLLFITLLIASGFCAAYNLNRDINDLDKPSEGKILTIPYVFYNENTEFAAAVAVTSVGFVQPQTAAVLNAFYSSNDTTNLFP